MSAINTKIKTIILTAISAAILSACGGGGGSGGASTLSTGSTSTSGNGSPAKNSSPSNAAPSATNNNNGNTVVAAAPRNNHADNLAGLIDEAPLETLNLATRCTPASFLQPVRNKTIQMFNCAKKKQENNSKRTTKTKIKAA